MTELTIVFPDDFSELKTLPAIEMRILSIAVVSGKSHGAFYIREGQSDTYNLYRQVSFDKEKPACFALIGSFDDENPDHLAVKDRYGNIAAFFHFRFADICGKYGADFVRNYLIPPAEIQKANMELTRFFVSKFSLELLNGNMGRNATSTDTLEQCNQTLTDITGLLAKSFQAGYALPDDNFQHSHGVSSLIMHMCHAINLSAMQRGKPVIFSEKLIKTVQNVSFLHDIGKLQIPMRLNHHNIDEYLHPDDMHKSQEEQFSIHEKKKQFVTEKNYNHPIFGYLALSFYPELAEVAALHHLSLFRDYSSEVREQLAPVKMICNDVGRKEAIPFISQIFRVADVTDAIINSARKDPVTMLKELNRETRKLKPIGLPSIDPDILCFMLEWGVIDTYLLNKTVSPLHPRDLPSRPRITPEYDQVKTEILTAHCYKPRKTKIELRILQAVTQEPLVRAYRSKLLESKKSNMFVLQNSACITDFPPAVMDCSREVVPGNILAK